MTISSDAVASGRGPEVPAGPPGPLAWPVACVGLYATVVVILQTHRFRPTPAMPMVLVAAVLSLLRSRTARVTWFAPVVVAAFVALPTPGIGAWLRVVAGLAFGVGLVPVMLSSLRAGKARGGSVADGSQRRSPWVVAAGTAALVGELARQTYTGLELIPDASVYRSPWEGAVTPLHALAAAGALALSLPDLRALLHTPRKPWTPVATSLAFSVAIDTVAVAVATTCLCWRVLG